MLLKKHLCKWKVPNEWITKLLFFKLCIFKNEMFFFCRV